MEKLKRPQNESSYNLHSGCEQKNGNIKSLGKSSKTPNRHWHKASLYVLIHKEKKSFRFINKNKKKFLFVYPECGFSVKNFLERSSFCCFMKAPGDCRLILREFLGKLLRQGHSIQIFLLPPSGLSAQTVTNDSSFHFNLNFVLQKKKNSC